MSRALRAAALISAILGAAARPAAAQLRGNLSIAAGASFPTSAFGDFQDTGYNVLVALGLNPPLLPIGFRVDGMFNEFDRTGSSDKTRVLGLTANVTLGLGGLLGPYLIGGIGEYSTRYPSPFGDRTDFGINVGGGFRFGLTGFSAFAEARYHRAGDAAQFIPVSFGVTF